MAMYLIQLVVRDPVTGDHREKTAQFDPATFNATSWAALWVTFQGMISSLQTGIAGRTDVPPVWT
jgi:hypothetical protein